MKTAPFDLQKALAGHPLVTRGGHKIREFKIAAPEICAWPYSADKELYNKEGRWDMRGKDSEKDLFLLLPDTAQFPKPPKGEQWHNPGNLTPEQVGISDGWRLCLIGESCDIPHELFNGEGWTDAQRGKQWKFGEETSEFTYRTKAPLPQPKQPRDRNGRFAARVTDTVAVTAPDPVNHPSHYTSGGIECIDAIRAALGRDGFVAFCRGNVLKYSWRADKKGNCAEDMQKAAWYSNKAAETEKGN